MIRVDREEHVAVDADAPVDERHAPGRQRAGQRLLQCLAALCLGLALLDLVFQLGGQLQLHADHADQNQHKRAQQHRHQVAERGPDRRRGLDATVDLVVHAASVPASARWSPSRCRSSRICF